METDTMRPVLTEATIENAENLWAAKRGIISESQVRRLALTDALVDTGTTLLSLPTHMIQQLGLEKSGSRRVTSSTGGGETD
jgi:hypothetical protein